MFFARVRWIGRVLDEAGIDTNSKTGREFTTALVEFSKYGGEKNRRGDGAMRLDVGPAGWALLGAMLASEESRVASHLSAVLGLSETEVSAMLMRISQAALNVAKRDLPKLHALVSG